MSAHALYAPFPWFGGKRRAAPLIWPLLGDPGGYVEPFAGSAAVLLLRPGTDGPGWRRVETLNDADGWLVNFWRSIQLSPAQTAAHCAGPVIEVDYHARLAWLQERRGPDLIGWLEGDPEAHDPRAAGWWCYVVCCGIGDPFGPGPWRVVDGRLTRTGNAGRGVNRELPHLGNAGQGVNRELPHLGDAGQGVNRELPHLGNAGQGVTNYFGALAARLARVRITCGSWERVTTPAVVRGRSGGDGTRAVFLDPPYSHGGDLYAAGDTDGNLSAQVRAWCLNADPAWRIVLAGYDTDHDELVNHGWRKSHGKAGRGAGYAGATRPENGRRERLWASPACLDPQGGLW